MAVAGAIISGLGVVLFRLANTTVNPMKPESSSSLIQSGIYRLTRNPMYLGMVIALVGLAVLLGTLGAFVPIPFFAWQIRRKFVLPEEAFLEGIFRGRYLEYKARVRRWL
jgi:protein-S-isoprenylcysteine O-methyltransferase Ste14